MINAILQLIWYENPKFMASLFPLSPILKGGLTSKSFATNFLFWGTMDIKTLV